MGTKNPEQFNIRWNNYTVVVQSVFRKLLEDERLVDVTLACEGGSLKCHRLVLSACSPYFENLLTQYPEDKHVIIFLKDMKYWTLQFLVHFMYHGEMSIKQVQLPVLIRAAESLQIRGLSSDTSEGLDSDMEKLSDDEESQEYAGEEVESRTVQNETSQRRQMDNKGQRGTGNDQRSLLRPQQHQQNNSTSSRGAGMNSMPTKKRALPPAHSTGPPKLTKMQRLDDKETNGIGSIPSSFSSSSTQKQVQSKPQKSPPPSLEKFVEGSSANAIDYGSEEDDGFPHETSVEAERDDAYIKEENKSVSSVNAHLDYDGEDASGSEIDDSSQAPAGGRRFSYKYPKEIRESVLSNLKSGMSIKECTDASGIPRKTISKWRNQDLQESTSTKEEGGMEHRYPSSRASRTLRSSSEGSSTVGNQSGSISRQSHHTKAFSIDVDHLLDGESKGPSSLPPGLHPKKIRVIRKHKAEILKEAAVEILKGMTFQNVSEVYDVPKTTLRDYMVRQGLLQRGLRDEKKFPGLYACSLEGDSK